MTNTTRTKRNIVITAIAFIAIVLLFGIGSSWFRNWNFRSWFNYWGVVNPAAIATQAHDDDIELSQHSDSEELKLPELEEEQ